jgi:hypothetical protein
MDDLDLLAAGFGLVGLVITHSAGRQFRLGRRSVKWPWTPGEVISSEVSVRYERDSGLSDDDVTRTRGFTRPDVRYRYLVGHPRIGTRVSVDAQVETSGLNLAQRWVDKYPPGKKVRVYYDPDDPDEVVLERGEGNFSVFFLGLGLLLLGFCLAHFLRNSPFSR